MNDTLSFQVNFKDVGTVDDLVFSSDGQYLGVAMNGDAQIRGVNDRAYVERLDAYQEPSSGNYSVPRGIVGFKPDNKTLVLGLNDGTIYHWRIEP